MLFRSHSGEVLLVNVVDRILRFLEDGLCLFQYALRDCVLHLRLVLLQLYDVRQLLHLPLSRLHLLPNHKKALQYQLVLLFLLSLGLGVRCRDFDLLTRCSDLLDSTNEDVRDFTVDIDVRDVFQQVVSDDLRVGDDES